MKKMISKFKTSLFISLVSVSNLTISTELDPDMVTKAKDLNTTLSSFYKDKNSLADNVSNPLLSDSKMKTSTGIEFDANIGCKSSNTFLEILALPSPTGEASINVSVDGDMNGALDTVHSITNVSGVCANGYIKCDPGTWNNCKDYEWKVSGGMSLVPTLVPPTLQGELLKSCYCINNSCGSGLLVNNFHTVTKDIGSGVANAYQKINPYYTISGVEEIGPLVKFQGQEPASCHSTFDGTLTTYKDNPGNISSAAFSAKSSNPLFSKIEGSLAAGNESRTIQACTVQREVTLSQIKVNEVIEWVSGNGRISYCGDGCIELTVGDEVLAGKSGTCSTFTDTAKFKINDPNVIISAKMIRANFDDWIYSTTNGEKTYAGPFDWNGITFPAGKGCELSTVWNKSLNIDLTTEFKKGGVIELKNKLKVDDKGHGFTKYRVYVDLADEINFSVKIGAPGDQYIGYNFDLLNNTNSIDVRDSKRGSIIQMPTGLDFADLCANGYEIEYVGSSDWVPPPPYNSPKYDTTVNLSVRKYPTCDNGLQGNVRINDRSNGNGLDYKYALGQEFRFQAVKKKCGVSGETIHNACLPYESNPKCSLKDESIDGVDTWINFIATGLLPIQQTEYLSSGVCLEAVTRDWFHKDRNYSCTSGVTQWDFSDALQRQHTVVSSASTGGYTDQQFDPTTGSSTFSTHSIDVPDTPNIPACINACKTRKLVSDTGVNELGVSANNRSNSTKYEYFYHECDAGACPAGPGEQVIKACSCLDEFAEAASVMQILRLSGKDMICTSGSGTPVE